MYVVRRHSRKLFFPAGLLALAWLLCLGCALLAARPELRPRQRVLQFSVPSISSLTKNHYATISFPPEWRASPKQLATMHPWYTVRFTDNPWENQFSDRMATFLARQLVVDPNQDRGLRIEFDHNSHYQSLVAMLNMFNSVGITKYWLDIQHEPTSLNTFTEPPVPQTIISKTEPLPLLSKCGGIINEPELPPAPLHVGLATLVDTAMWQLLLASRWRYSTLLLLFLPLTAAWQLRRLQTANARR